MAGFVFVPPFGLSTSPLCTQRAMVGLSAAKWNSSTTFFASTLRPTICRSLKIRRRSAPVVLARGFASEMRIRKASQIG